MSHAAWSVYVCAYVLITTMGYEKMAEPI